MKRFLYIQIVFLTTFVLSFSAFEYPKTLNKRVNDHAGILSSSDEMRIEETLASHERATGNQIVVAIFPSLEGESLEDITIKMLEDWKVGEKGKDNGVALFFFMEEREIRIEVGYGLEGVLPDVNASQIIRYVIAPKFKAGDYAGGIENGVKTIISVLGGGSMPSQPQREYEESDMGGALAGFILALAGFLLIIDFLRYGGYRIGNRTYSHRYGFLEWMLTFSALLFILKLFIMMAASGRSFGGRGGASFGGGGGFSGGGGSFGGGGASGSW